MIQKGGSQVKSAESNLARLLQMISDRFFDRWLAPCKTCRAFPAFLVSCAGDHASRRGAKLTRSGHLHALTLQHHSSLEQDHGVVMARGVFA